MHIKQYEITIFNTFKYKVLLHRRTRLYTSLKTMAAEPVNRAHLSVERIETGLWAAAGAP